MDDDRSPDELFSLALECSEKGQEERARAYMGSAACAGINAAREGHPRAPDFLQKMAEFYVATGFPESAVHIFETARRDVLENLAPEHPVRFRVLYSMFMLYRHLGRLEEALEPVREAIECLRADDMADPGALGDALMEMAAVYDELVRPAEAEAVFKEALGLFALRLGKYDPLTILSRLRLACFYREQRRFGEAEPLYREALDTAERVHGRDDLKASCLNNLALFYLDRDRHDLAEGLMAQAIEIGERVYPADHPDRLTGLTNLAKLYMQQRRFAEAERLYEQVMQILNHLPVGSSPFLPIVQMRMAEIRLADGRIEEAESHGKFSLSAAVALAGPDHPDVHNYARKLAEMLRSQGKIGDPDDLIKQYCYMLEAPDGIVTEESYQNVVLLRGENPWNREALETVARALCGSGQRAPRKGRIRRTARKALERSDAEGAWILMKLLYLRKNGKLSGKEIDYLVGAGALVGLERSTREIHHFLKISDNGTSPLGVHYALAKLNLFGSCWPECLRWSEKVYQSDSSFRGHEMLNDMAYSLIHLGQEPDRALQLARQVYQEVVSSSFSQEENSWVTDTLGLALLRNGQNMEALGLLDQGYRANPCIMHAFHLAEAYYRTGNAQGSSRLLRMIPKLEASCFEERQIQACVNESNIQPEKIWD